MAVWGIYPIRTVGKRQAGESSSRDEVKWQVRWRVEGVARKRTFARKGHAKDFHDRLTVASVNGWHADLRGYPVDPAGQTSTGRTITTQPAEAHPDTETQLRAGLSFADYCTTTWWPINETRFKGKNLLGHRRNMRVAIDLMTYPPADPRCDGRPGTGAGESILLGDLVADDVRRALVRRRSVNGRTAAVNQRTMTKALTQNLTDISIAPETASDATVRAFYITLSLILRDAASSQHLSGDPLNGTAVFARAPKPGRVTDRLVPSLAEIFDLADAIAELGPIIGGRPAGERYRSLILTAGTIGARPGELTAHRPEWILFGDPTRVRLHRSETPLYDTETGLRGRNEGPLKQRSLDEWREIPTIDEVADALREHIERGYPGRDRTWTSPTGRGHLDWGNIRDDYWRPACSKVFAGTDKANLATMPPKTLRKAAITWWADSGIPTALAADWAGHSEEVAARYYAGRASNDYTREVALLSQNRTH